MGLMSAHDVLSDERLYELIFVPGFSTAEKVNELSGRGVGLDVVRQKRRRAQRSNPARIAARAGNPVHHQAAAHPAIVDGMRVAVADESYILPLASIIEVHPSWRRRGAAHRDQGHVVDVRGEYLPLVSLGSLFGMEAADRSRASRDLETDGNRIALIVDARLGRAARDKTLEEAPQRHQRQNSPDIDNVPLIRDGRPPRRQDGCTR